jgi:VWFA-related protein
VVRGPLTAVLLAAVVAAPQERPTFRVTTRLVQVSVVVQDRDGKPVTGLTAADFQLLDGGQQQRIVHFAIDGAEASSAAGDRPSAAPVPGAVEFTNRTVERSSATMILFDRLNTPAADQLFARRHLLAFLRQIRSDDRVGIYVLDGGTIQVLHDFSNDAASLVRAVARYDVATSREVDAAETAPPDLPSTGSAAVDAAFQAALDRLTAEMTAHFNGIRSDATIAAFEAIAGRLASVEGRKSLIWITSGFPLDGLARGTNITTKIQQATRPLNDANVAVYAVDARGLVGAFTYGPRGVPMATTLSRVHTNLDVLQIAAEETGGRAFHNTNDIQASVRRAVDDGRVAYTLGYYPSHGKWNGTFRAIKVRVNRPGVSVRHRRGYLAGAAPRDAESQRARAIDAAIRNPLEATAIPLTARVHRDTQTPAQLRLNIRVDASALGFDHADEHWTTKLNVVVAQKLADGTTIKDVDRTIEVRLRQDRYDDARTRGLTIDAAAMPHASMQRLHIIVQDASTGSVGSIVVPRDRIPLARIANP